MKILIDNGHGQDTKGKRSPRKKDGTRLYEWEYTRKVAKEVVNTLIQEGYDATLLTPEDKDISITKRCQRANAYCNRLGAKNVLLVSIHLDAMGCDDKWHNARGWSARVALNASTRSKKLASCLHTCASGLGVKTRVPLPNQPYWMQNLGICRDTYCPAILTENLFQDNETDVAFLESADGFDKIVKIHVQGIKNYILSYI